MDAMQRGDVEAVVEMLTEDSSWSMPPLPDWFSPREQVEEFLRAKPLSGQWRWTHRPTRVNGQAAVACYTFDEGENAFIPFCVDVLTLEGDRIKEVTAFIARTEEIPDDGSFDQWPDYEPEPSKVTAIFTRLNLPDRLGPEPVD